MTVTFIRTDKESIGCYSVLMAFAGIMLAVSLYGIITLFDIDDIGEYFFELVFILIMLVSFGIQFFRKKAKKIKSKVFIRNNKLYLDDMNAVAISDLRIDLIESEHQKTTYFLWDTNHKVSMLSYNIDDLSEFLMTNGVEHTNFTQVKSNYHSEAMSYFIEAKPDLKLIVNVETGMYERTENESVITATPDYFVSHPAFKRK